MNGIRFTREKGRIALLREFVFVKSVAAAWLSGLGDQFLLCMTTSWSRFW